MTHSLDLRPARPFKTGAFLLPAPLTTWHAMQPRVAKSIAPLTSMAGGSAQVLSVASPRLVTRVTRLCSCVGFKVVPGEVSLGFAKWASSHSLSFDDGSFARSGPLLDRPRTWQLWQLSLLK